MRLIVPAVLVTLLLSAAAPAQVPFVDETFDHDPDHPAAGLWYGNLIIDGAARYGVFEIDHDAGRWSVKATIASIIALGAEATEVEIDGASISFSVAGQLAAARLEGIVADGAQRMSGTVTVQAAQGEPLVDGFELARLVPVMSLPGAMAFTGEIDIQGVMKLGMTIALARTTGGSWIGHADVPAQMTHGFLFTEVRRDGAKVTAVMPGPAPALLDLELSEDERRLTGTMSQGPYTLDLDFARHDGYVGSALMRPQHPVPPYPYEAREVTIEHPDGHTLAGTLTIPAAGASGAGPFPAAVLITGSGAQDRDESLLGHKPFLVIADHLTRKGIAVLRYDDRGYGRSTGSFATATSADFATDVEAAVAFLKTQPDVRGEAIGLIGHSEGALIAPMVAGSVDDLAYIVLLAGPGVPGDELLVVQGEKILRGGGADEETVARGRREQKAIFALLRSDRSDEELRTELRAHMEAVAGEDEDNPLEGETLRQAIEAQIAQLMTPWFRYFLVYDPRPGLAAVRCPILALNGTLDLQVWHEQNLDEIERVVQQAGGDVTVRRYENLNHLFQPAKTGTVGEYAEIEITIDERVLREMTEWIAARVVNLE